MEKLKHWFYYTRSGLVVATIGLTVSSIPLLLASLIHDGWTETYEQVRAIPCVVRSAWKQRAPKA